MAELLYWEEYPLRASHSVSCALARGEIVVSECHNALCTSYFLRVWQGLCL
jgi:hypothetical protein